MTTGASSPSEDDGYWGYRLFEPAPSCSAAGSTCAAGGVALLVFGVLVVAWWRRRRGAARSTCR